MSEDELTAIENGPWSDKGPAMALVAEVRRLNAERQAVRREALLDAAAEIRRRLAYNDQRAVSWHEVEDCADAVTSLADQPSEPEKCRHNTAATSCTECRALGKMVSLK